LALTSLGKEKKETKRKMIPFNGGFAICNCRICFFLSLNIFTVEEERKEGRKRRRTTLLVKED
jgi:hypothetical protein